MLKGTQGAKALEPSAVSPKRFWQVYLALLEVNGMSLTPKERDTLVYVLTGEPGRDYFSTPHNKQMMRDLNMVKSELSRMKRRLIEKGLIDKETWIPSRALLLLQRQVNLGRPLTFVYPMQVEL